MARRGGRNRLGFALQLCALRYLGRPLHPGEELPYAVVAFVAEQIGVASNTLDSYAFRPNTKYEHSAALQDLLSWRPFEGRARQDIEAWLDQASLTARTGAELAVGFRDELRRRKIIVPGITTIERLCAASLTRCERAVLARLTEDLDREKSARLDQLFDISQDVARLAPSAAGSRQRQHLPRHYRAPSACPRDRARSRARAPGTPSSSGSHGKASGSRSATYVACR